MDALGSGTTSTVIVREARIASRDLNPGQKVDGVVCLKEADGKPTVYRFVFGNDESHQVSAAAVL